MKAGRCSQLCATRQCERILILTGYPVYYRLRCRITLREANPGTIECVVLCRNSVDDRRRFAQADVKADWSDNYLVRGDQDWVCSTAGVEIPILVPAAPG